MWEKNVNQRLLLIGVVLVCALAVIRDPRQTLRPGLDIAGGVSLMFEIDDRGMENYPNLAEDMKRLLQKRVDPKGVYDLAWRVHGRNRLEVQMPLPPARAQQLRRQYADALDQLFAATVTRGQLEQVLSMSGPERQQEFTRLAAGSAERRELLEKAAAAYDAYVAALSAYRAGPQPGPAENADPATQPTTEPATSSAPARTLEELEIQLRDAEENLEDAYEAFLATNLDRATFLQILELEPTSPIRRNGLEELKRRYPHLRELIERVVAAHAEWRKNRGYLDGPADLQRLLRGAGVLEFRILAEPSPENETKYDRYRRQLHERGPTPAPGDDLGWFKVDNPQNFFDLKSIAELERYDPRTDRRFVVEKVGKDFYVLAKLSPEDGLLGTNRTWQLRSARADRDEHGRPAVHFQLDVVGARLFEELTRKNIGRPLCILLDNIAYSAPTIRSKIGMHGQITGDFSQEQVRYLVQTMQAGSLPARLKETPISERTIGSSLGLTNRDMAFRSGVIGVVLVALFMAGYYFAGGLIADTAMLMNVVLVLAVMALLQARITLPGIAGIILTIGMSVDANVLINERMREEKHRGSSLRLIIKNGYDKAFSVILDANLTTVLTCAILYYVGSEEVKGFGLTLGWGIVISMFTALFVTRTIFALLTKYGWLRQIRMLQLIGVPRIDWYAKRKFFIPLSLVLTIGGLTLLAKRGYRNFLDVEFLGGVSAEVEVRPPRADEKPLDDVQIAAALRAVGAHIAQEADKLSQAVVEPLPGQVNAYHIKAEGLSAEQLAAMLTESLEDQGWPARGGIEPRTEDDSLIVRLQTERSAEQLQAFVRGQVSAVRSAGNNIANASVGSVSEAGFGQQKGRFWSITTTEKNRRLVQQALELALGDRLQRQQRIRYRFHGDSSGRPFPITDRRIEGVISDPNFPVGVVARPLTDYLGGAAMYFTDLDPPQCVDPAVAGSIPDRLRNMRLQPGYQDYPYRRFEVFGIQRAVGPDNSPLVDEAGRPLFTSVVIVVVDENYRYTDDPERWAADFAQKELTLATSALEAEQSLRKVSLFKPQVARQAATQALLALVLAWLMIIAYLWVRFGRPMYGVAAVVALIHDVCMALAFVGIAGWIGGSRHPIGAALLIEDFKVNMTIVAALLTIIGYSVNDTIVVFDRIREMRGRMAHLTPQIINDAINQCMSRTILTSLTVFVVVLVMYIFGGSSIRGFNWCMMVGAVTGTYSSIAIAAPLLLLRWRPAAQPARA
jgi:SecD/SecF fusion protein